ncbi:MAG: DUF2892 domain-containing protein [Pseudomonadota bacterium]
MTKNMGETERFLRINLGLVLLMLVFIGPHTPLGLIGLLPLATGLFEICPAKWIWARRAPPVV